MTLNAIIGTFSIADLDRGCYERWSCASHSN